MAFTGMKIDHVLLGVKNLDAMADWYCRALGFKFVVKWPVGDGTSGNHLVYVAREDFWLELIDGVDMGTPPVNTSFVGHLANRGFTHLCFGVESADKAVEAALAAGATLVREASTLTLGPHYTRRVGFVADPEGNVLEFAEPLVQVN